jgi:hypothetical protein
MCACFMTYHWRRGCYEAHHRRQERATRFIHQDARSRVIAVRHQRIGGAKIDADDRVHV